MLITHRHDRQVHHQAGVSLESLDARILLSSGAPAATAETLVHDQPAFHAHHHHDLSRRELRRDGLPAALPANVSGPLRSLYREYKDQVALSGSSPSLPGEVLHAESGSRVAVRIKVAFPPALGAYVSKLRQDDGLRVMRTVPAEGMVEGTLPVAKLPAVAKLAAHVWPTSLPIKG